MSNPMVLVVQDASVPETTVVERLTPGYRVNVVPLCCDMVREVVGRGARVVVFDLWRLSEAAMRALSLLHEQLPHVSLLVTSIDAEAGVRSLRRNVPLADWIPRTMIGRLPASVEAALRTRLNRSRFLSYKQRLCTDAPVSARWDAPIVAESPGMHGLLLVLEAAAEETLLFCGEPGSGRATLAQAAHRMYRGNAPLEGINALGLSCRQLQSLIYGPQPGQPGALGRARLNGGSVLLCNVDALNVEALALLRTLICSRLIEGGDLPLVFATATPGWRFDPRLVALEVPPLRDRPHDVEPLARQFLRDAAREMALNPVEPPEPLVSAMQRYRFPGNVSELRSLMYALAASPRQGLESLLKCRAPELCELLQQA